MSSVSLFFHTHSKVEKTVMKKKRYEGFNQQGLTIPETPDMRSGLRPTLSTLNTATPVITSCQGHGRIITQTYLRRMNTGLVYFHVCVQKPKHTVSTRLDGHTLNRPKMMESRVPSSLEKVRVPSGACWREDEGPRP